MDGFFVDSDDLECAANHLRTAGSSVDSNSLLQYTVSARSTGSEVLAGALASFNMASRTALTSLRNESGDLADRMAETARTYREVDVAVTELMAACADATLAPIIEPALRSS